MYANRIAQIEDRPSGPPTWRPGRRQEAALNLLRMGSELVVDAVVEPAGLRAELIADWPPPTAGADARPAPSRRQPGVTGAASEAQ